MKRRVDKVRQARQHWTTDVADKEMRPMQQKSIFLIDNCDLFGHFQDLIINVCRQAGHHIDAVRRIDLARERLERESYDLYIVDQDLGREFIGLHGKAPILAHDYVNDRNERSQCSALGYDGVIARHYSADEISFAVNSTLFASSLGRQRAYPRVVANRLAELSYAGEREVEEQIAEVVNLSEGGAFVKSYSPWQRGSTIEIEVPLEEGDEVPLFCQGKVVYSKPYFLGNDSLQSGMGVQFTTLSSVDQRRLQLFVERRIR